MWCGLSDVAMEEALYDTPLHWEFAGLGGTACRHLLEQHQLAEQFLKTVTSLCYWARKQLHK